MARNDKKELNIQILDSVIVFLDIYNYSRDFHADCYVCLSETFFLSCPLWVPMYFVAGGCISEWAWEQLEACSKTWVSQSMLKC